MDTDSPEYTQRYGPTRPMDGALQKIHEMRLDRIATVGVIRHYRSEHPEYSVMLDEIEWTLTGVAPTHFVSNSVSVGSVL